MNDDTRIFLRQAGTLILSAAIGGFIGGMFANCCHHCHCMKHMHFHHGPMKPFGGKFEEKRFPKFEERFFEEDYIIIPKDLLNSNRKNEKNLKPFDDPRPENKN